MPRAVQRATAADVPYSMSSGCATTQSTRRKDSSGRAGNVMSAILPEPFPVASSTSGFTTPREGTPPVINPCPSTQDQDEKPQRDRSRYAENSEDHTSPLSSIRP